MTSTSYQFDAPTDPSWRVSGQEAVVAVAELMAAFREVEQTRPGFCDELIHKIVSCLQTPISHEIKSIKNNIV